ncbi:membrane protein [Corynebacterium diphtheriae]|nr:membrane protein [Corynebacterium diphtheriae]CAB0814704.1 membrane protein [Corynebacterium diphtheriae]
MNIRTTKIVAPLVAMALCNPNIAFAQEELNQKTISGRTEVNKDYSLTRSISAINRNNSTYQEPNTIYVNPGDTIHVKLYLEGKPGNANHGFTSFTEKVSPIQESSAISGSLTVKRDHSSTPLVKALDELPNNDTFQKTSKQTIEFKANSPSHFGQLGNQLTIDYSYIAGNELGRYKTQFIPHKNFAGDSSVFDKEKLNLTIVVESKEESRPPAEEDKRPTPPDQDGQDTPPDQDEQVIPPKSNRSTGFSLLTKALGVLAFLGGTVWFIIKHIFRL